MFIYCGIQQFSKGTIPLWRIVKRNGMKKKAVVDYIISYPLRKLERNIYSMTEGGVMMSLKEIHMNDTSS